MRRTRWCIFLLCCMSVMVVLSSCGSSKPTDKDLKDAEDKIEQVYKKSQPPALDGKKTTDAQKQTIEQPIKSTTSKTDTTQSSKTPTDATKTDITKKDTSKTDVKKPAEKPESSKKTDTVKNETTGKTTPDTGKTVTTTQNVTTTKKPQDSPVTEKKIDTKKTVVSKDAAKDPKERNVEDVVKEKETYQYKSHNKRDPFINPYATPEEKDGSTTQQSVVDAEDVDFSKLNYRGIIHYGNEVVAMLEDDSGRGIVLKIGSVIGGAKVESITREMVVLRRFVIKTEGQPRDIILHKVTE